MEIDSPRVLVHLRGKIVERHRPPVEGTAMSVLARVFADRRRYERAQRVARAGQRPLVRDGRISRLPGPLSAWTDVRDMPPVAKQTFREWWHERA